MPQYSSKKVALIAFQRFFCPNIMLEPREGGIISPAEDLLLGALVQLVEERRERGETFQSQKFEIAREKAFRHLKSIARACGHWPLKEEMIPAYRMRQKMGKGIGELIESQKSQRQHHGRGTERRSGRWEVITGPIQKRQ